MAELRFAISSAAPVQYAASPLLALDVRVESENPSRVWCFAPASGSSRRAHHHGQEDDRLKELFGHKSQWSRGSRSLLWTQVVNVVSAFQSSTTVAIALPCSFDLAAIASKYVRALDGGTVPIRAQFGGTAFFRREHGLSAAPIALDREAEFGLPVQTFREVLDQHFPDSAVVTLQRGVYDRLEALRVQRGLSSFDQAVEDLLTPRTTGSTRTKRGVA